MYTDSISPQTTMGDVDVVWHDGLYHLFHLVLPNHDFIAHAISKDGLNWKRVENAIFIGHPGSWDDHMLWTMHVTRDPHEPGSWRMFYTGLSRRDSGTVQRIGMARSRDLRYWEKGDHSWKHAAAEPPIRASMISGKYDAHSPFPLCAKSPHYEYEPDGGKGWVSFRDPFYFREADRGMLVMAARVDDGPMIRRGCVGCAEEVEPGRFELGPPVHHPGLYEDIEVPNLIKLNGRYYLIGGIREDVKVRYWHAPSLRGPWENFFDNVVLASGNYAARVCWDDRGPLIWNFFTAGLAGKPMNLMPPPKRLSTRPNGQLSVSSFEAFDDLVTSTLTSADIVPLQALRSNPDALQKFDSDSGELTLLSIGGFESFLIDEEVYCFRFRARIHLDGLGKCGLLFRYDPTTSNGYHLSLDLLKGVAQVRQWGEDPDASAEQAFSFRTLQASYWQAERDREWEIEVVALQTYLEFSIDGQVILSLADTTYSTGCVGIYVESACLSVRDFTLEHLEPPSRPSGDLPEG
jgi:beta-fructofuranosidase